jgi:hypothetical protein
LPLCDSQRLFDVSIHMASGVMRTIPPSHPHAVSPMVCQAPVSLQRPLVLRVYSIRENQGSGWWLAAGGPFPSYR